MESLLASEFRFPQQWLPDETLFSLCSRYHQASGNRLASTTCRALFGHPNQGSAHDFPARLHHFSAATGTALGSVAQIVEHHTILPFYLRFASDALAEQVITAAGENSTGRLKFQLGLLTSRFRANHPLKACPMCMPEDEKNFTTAYWHRQHQLPGVWICQRHGCALLSSNLKATGIARFQWLLPSSAQLHEPASVLSSRNIAKFAEMVTAVGTRAGLQLRPEALSLAFRAELNRRGFLKGSTQRLRHEAAGESYAEFLKPLLCVDQLGNLPVSGSMACADIVKQIGPGLKGVHPLRRLGIAAWLYQDLDALLGQCLPAQAQITCRNQAPPALGRRNSVEALQDARQRRFFSELSTGKSTSAAAKATDIDVTTAMAWSAANGITVSRRPKALKPDLRQQLIAMLSRGTSKHQAATFGQVSIQTITKLLRTEVGLHEAWKQAAFTNAQRSNRLRWTHAVTSNPFSGLKAARMANPSVYAWLYRNDRDWLKASSLKLAKRTRTGGVRVNWDERDGILASLVREVATSLVAMEGIRRLKLCQLYQRIPELKAKLSKLDRLPLTKAAINMALRTKIED